MDLSKPYNESLDDVWIAVCEPALFIPALIPLSPVESGTKYEDVTSTKGADRPLATFKLCSCR